MNETFAYSKFTAERIVISNIKLTEGKGIDGVTNTFAAGIWVIEMMLEYAQMGGYEIDYNYDVFRGNYQAFLGAAPDFRPTPLYQALLFATMLRDGSPYIILPKMYAGTSSKIKVYVLNVLSRNAIRIVIMNKDTNSSLDGKV